MRVLRAAPSFTLLTPFPHTPPFHRAEIDGNKHIGLKLDRVK